MKKKVRPPLHEGRTTTVFGLCERSERKRPGMLIKRQRRAEIKYLGNITCGKKRKRYYRAEKVDRPGAGKWASFPGIRAELHVVQHVPPRLALVCHGQSDRSGYQDTFLEML